MKRYRWDEQSSASFPTSNDVLKGASTRARSEVEAESGWLSTTNRTWVLACTRNFMLGGVAGAVGAYVTYPINYVKMLLQYQRRPTRGTSEVRYQSSWDCMTKVIRSHGVSGLFRGVVPQILGVTPEKAIKLATNDAVRSILTPYVTIALETGVAPTPMLSLFVDVFAGACGGASQVIFTNVGEILMIRLALQREVGLSTGGGPAESVVRGRPAKGMLTIVRELGFRGLYTGAMPCLARDSTFAAIFFPLYYRVRDHLNQSTWMPWSGDVPADIPEAYRTACPLEIDRSPVSAATVAAIEIREALRGGLPAGVLAGSVAAGLTTPFDVIKTTMQAERSVSIPAYTSMMQCARHIYFEEGALAFWKGMGPRMARSAPQFGVTLLAYELLQVWWRSLFPSSMIVDDKTNHRKHEGVDIGEFASESS